MAELENHTLHLLRKMNRDLKEMREKIDRNYEKHQKRLNGLQLAIQGDSFVDLCAVANFDTGISALEKRVVRPRKPK